jgi:exodeoxyribonuclease V gamma subunit
MPIALYLARCNTACAMLTVYCSNHFEVLADRVAERLEQSPAGPFEAHHVIVPSTAVRRAINLHLARRHGVSANLQTSFLAQWLWDRVAALVPGVQTDSPYAAQRLGWQLSSLLEDTAADHPRLSSYLGAADALMQHDLAMQVAERFEQYTTYRPHWLANWEQHRLHFQSADHSYELQQDERWQAALWRLVQQNIQPAVADPIEHFLLALQTLQAEGWRARGQPAEVQVLALPSIAPQHARLLGALSRVMDVHLHVINPCREYWFDLIDARRLTHLHQQRKADGHEVGHPLLAGWGKQAQSHLGVLVEAFVDHFEDDGGYRETDRPTLLGALQNSILNLTPLVPGSLPQARGDSSLEIHACHSLSRQLEVLQDRLLTAFAEPQSDLAPGDVLVVVPDLESASPVIEAIFGTPPAERRMPFRVSGLAGARTNPIARALLDILSCASGRAEISRLMDLLAQEPIARSIALTPSEHERVSAWLVETGVHWGLDAAHRAGFPGAEGARHTLADGLERLFLSYAMPEDSESSYLGRWPAIAVQGSDSLALGKLWRFASNLTEIAGRLSQPLQASQWKELLETLPDRFLEIRAQDFDDLQTVRRSMARLFENMSGHDPLLPIPATVMLRSLQEAFADPARGGVPTGVITFAAPGGLRYLPFKIIAFLGLDDGVFPGRTEAQEFDLLRHDPRLSDRQRRTDERNLFLDLLLTARERFILGYTAFSIRDNAQAPPSLLISELLDALDTACPDDVRQAILVEHPLQAFDRRAFLPTSDARIRSHDTLIAQAWQAATPLRARGEAPDGPHPFFDTSSAATQPPSTPDEVSDTTPGTAPVPLSLEDLIAILRDPAVALLKARTGMRFDREPDPLQDAEPLITGKRTLARLERRAARRLMQGASLEPVRARSLQAPGISTGWLGEQPVKESLRVAQAYVLRVRAELEAGDPVAEPRAVTLVLDSTGPLNLMPGLSAKGLRTTGLVLALEDLREEHALMTGWIQHLALLSWGPAGVNPQTRVHTLQQTLTFGPVDDPRGTLDRLFELGQRALREPTPFFPAISLAFARKQDLTAAEDLWNPRRTGQWAESDRPEIERVWRGRESPIASDAFEHLALAVFEPMLAACEISRV